MSTFILISRKIMLTNESNNDFEKCVLKYTGFSVSKGLEDIDHVMKTKIGTPITSTFVK